MLLWFTPIRDVEEHSIKYGPLNNIRIGVILLRIDNFVTMRGFFCFQNKILSCHNKTQILLLAFFITFLEFWIEASFDKLNKHQIQGKIQIQFNFAWFMTSQSDWRMFNFPTREYFGSKWLFPYQRNNMNINCIDYVHNSQSKHSHTQYWKFSGFSSFAVVVVVVCFLLLFIFFLFFSLVPL